MLLTPRIKRPAAAVDHGSPRLVEVATELRVGFVHVSWVRVAAVHLDVVRPPLGEGLGVRLEVVLAAWVVLTSLSTCQEKLYYETFKRKINSGVYRYHRRFQTSIPACEHNQQELSFHEGIF